jgi:hypothetical protein
MDVPLPPGSRPRKLAAISHQPPTFLTAVSRLSLDLLASPVRPVKSSKLLLALASPVVLIFRPLDHIFVLATLLRVLKWDLLFEERRGLTTTDHSPSTGEWPCWRSLSSRWSSWYGVGTDPIGVAASNNSNNILKATSPSLLRIGWW